MDASCTAMGQSRPSSSVNQILVSTKFGLFILTLRYASNRKRYRMLRLRANHLGTKVHRTNDVRVSRCCPAQVIAARYSIRFDTRHCPSSSVLNFALYLYPADPLEHPSTPPPPQAFPLQFRFLLLHRDTNTTAPHEPPKNFIHHV